MRRSSTSRALMLTAVVVAVGIWASSCTSEARHAAPAIVATARPGVTHAALLELAGSLVGGSDKLADPSSGRLPDLGAFRSAGIGTLSVFNSSIRVEFLPGATLDQQSAAAQTLRSSPLIAQVTTG